MKLKIVQPEVEKRETEEIELWLEYNSYGNVWLCSCKNGNVFKELRIDTSGDICISIEGGFKVDRKLPQGSNLRRAYL